MNPAARGMTLVDILVGTAIMVAVFAAIFGLLQASARISALAAETAAATAIANSQMEYLRSLPYDSVGTVGGIPAGVVAQSATTTEDGLPYGVRTFIDYYDDPADGSGGADSNGITTDYKRAKVTVTFTTQSGPHNFTIVSTVAPPGIETSAGGGTLRAVVVDAAGASVPGASVHIVNTSTNPAIDLTTYSDSTGVVYLPGAATSTEYQITVSKSGYSTAKTYDRDTTNQNPTPGRLTVVKDTTTSATFAIDRLATLTLTMMSEETETASSTPMPHVDFTLTGAKTIGSTGSGAAIYKTIIASSTGADGTATLPLEWDTYGISVPGYTIATSSPTPPYNLLPGTTTEAVLILTTP